MSSCSNCEASYSGNAGHCAACHRTFTSDSAFDRHFASLVTAGCRDPATVFDKKGRPKLEWNESRQMWQCPGRGDGFRWGQ